MATLLSSPSVLQQKKGKKGTGNNAIIAFFAAL
jgi:hypothetical protein